MREREIKIVLTDSFELPELADAIEGASLDDIEERDVFDVYYDTEDRRLARWGCTLRHRADEGWTVKIPKATRGVVMDREEVLVRGAAGEPPTRARNLVSSFTRGAEVVEVARLSTRRRQRAWRAGDDVLAIITDDEVRGRTADDAEEVTFRELEIELAPDADDAILIEVLNHLPAQIRSEPPLPKLVRVLGPDAMRDPDVVVTPLPNAPTARDVIRFALSFSAASLLQQLPAARLGVDPEGVHQARVAARRLRSDLKTFEPLLEPEWGVRLRSELRWLIDQLGAVRDCDVLEQILRGVAVDQPRIDGDAVARVLHQLALERRRHRARLLKSLSDARMIRLLDDVVAASSSPATLPRAEGLARKVMPRLVRRPWKRLDRTVNRLGSHPSPEELHALRIIAKRLRYAAEAVAPAVGKPARKFARDAATIQDALGELNDAVVAGVYLTSIADRLDGPAAFAGGQMAELLIHDARARDRQWRSAHRAMSRRTGWFS